VRQSVYATVMKLLKFFVWLTSRWMSLVARLNHGKNRSVLSHLFYSSHNQMNLKNKQTSEVLNLAADNCFEVLIDIAQSRSYRFYWYSESKTDALFRDLFTRFIVQNVYFVRKKTTIVMEFLKVSKVALNAFRMFVYPFHVRKMQLRYKFIVKVCINGYNIVKVTTIEWAMHLCSSIIFEYLLVWSV